MRACKEKKQQKTPTVLCRSPTAGGLGKGLQPQESLSYSCVSGTKITDWTKVREETHALTEALGTSWPGSLAEFMLGEVGKAPYSVVGQTAKMVQKPLEQAITFKDLALEVYFSQPDLTS